MGIKPSSSALLSPARRAAARVLSRVWEEGAYAHESLNSVIQHSTLTDLERSETTRLAYGAITYSYTLDYILIHLVSRFSGIKPRVRTALKLALYELYFTPGKDYAVISQGVELVKELHSYSAGTANAILRNAVKERESFPWDESRSLFDRKALAYSFPFWIAEKFAKECGEERAIEIMEASAKPAPLYGFVPRKVMKQFKESGLEYEFVDAEMLPQTVRFLEPSAAVNHPLIANREVLIADAVAQYVAQLYVSSFEPTTRQYKAVEIGSGRGTKTVIAAYSLRSLGATEQSAQLYAVDSHEFKSKITQEYARAHNLREITAYTLDATDADGLSVALLGETVDSLLIDAPCTGLGTLRRHPDKRDKLKVPDVADLARLSGELLAAGSGIVKPGGQIIYATCTISGEENGEVVASFLASEAGKGWRHVPFTEREIPAEWKDFVTENGFFQSFPKVDGPDGHFIARLVKSGPMH